MGGAVSTELSRKLRRNASPPERALWAILYHFRQRGFRFRRQVNIGAYYADFACHHPKLVIEIDGLSHTSPDYDAKRDAFMRAEGYRVLRVGNDHVLREIEGVMILVQHELGLKD